ncbi:ABC transporter substrate-binding protein [Candidatus Bathyarchaeota archaeon]|nr:ABC transporter substrate-binding protein [Candidatus Bathyarchaeota archaeon]
MGAPSEIRIGVISSTQANLETTIPILQMAEKDINSFLSRIGRNTQFTFIPSSAEGKASKSLDLLQSFHAKDIQFIVGPSWSSHAQTCLSYANDNDMILFSSTSSSPLLSIEDDSLFRLAPTDIMQAPVIAKMMKSQGIESTIILRRGDAWADGIYNYFEPIWKEYGFSLDYIRYQADQNDFIDLMKEADFLTKEAINKYGHEKVGILCISFSEIVNILEELERYPNLGSVYWYGCDGTVLSQAMLDTTPEQASNVKLLSTYAAPTESSKFNDLYDKYYEKTNQPFGFYSATIYDICWIYALSILCCNTIDSLIVANALPEISRNYFGASGRCNLNEAGDRSSCDYQIWGYAKNGDVTESQVFGLYSTLRDNVVWYNDGQRDIVNPFEKIYLTQEIDSERREVPLRESELVEFKQELPDNNKLAKILTSFANTKGGNLYVGVANDRTIFGISDIDALQLKITNISRDLCEPPLKPSFTIIEKEEGVILECYIPQSQRVHKVKNGKYFCRIGPSNRELSIDELEALFLSRSKKQN